jgi:NADH-quinone oxidoreductase subunit C
MNEELINKVKQRLEYEPKVDNISGIPSISIKKEDIINLCQFLKDLGFERIVDIFGIDNLYISDNQKRFQVIYHLSNIEANQRIFIQIAIGEDESVPSLNKVFPGAKAYELECSDMFGINFEGNELPKERFLLAEDFKGYPLRKNFPLRSY